jgi:hypothetical protein
VIGKPRDYSIANRQNQRVAEPRRRFDDAVSGRCMGCPVGLAPRWA